MEAGRTKVWRPIRIGIHAEGKALKPSSTNRFERSMIAVQSRLFIEKHRDFQLGSYLLPQPLRQMNTILHRRATQRNKRHDIRSPYPWMDALVLPKIDQIGRHANGAKGRLSNGIRFAGKTQDRAMVIAIHRLVQ